MSILSASGLQVLRERNFTLYLAARLLATLALQMQNVAIGWQVYELTGSLLDLGWIGLAQFAPFVLLILFAGQAADRYDRRRILAICHGLTALTSLLLLLFTVQGLTVVWPVLAVLVLVGCGRAFSMPANQAIVMNLVPAEHFGQAVAIGSSTFHVATIVGPVLGGFLYLAGPLVVYAVVATLLACSCTLMLFTRGSRQVVRREPVSWHALLGGLRFVWSRPVVLGAISLDLFAVLFGGAVALLPAVARDVLHVGPTGLGLLRTAPALGAAATAIVLAFRPIARHVGYWMFGGVALFGVATIVFGCSTSLPLSIVALALAGAGDMISVFVRHILVQYETPDEIRGRVSAVNAVFIGASNELGEFESGLTAGWLGLIRAIVVGGVATLVVSGAWMWRFPVLRRMDRFPHALRETTPAPTAAQPEAANDADPSIARTCK